MDRKESYVRTLKPVESDLGPLRPSVASISIADGRASVRRSAVTADLTATLEISLALVWRELVHGLCRVVDSFFTDDRCYLVLAATSTANPLLGRRLAILQAVLGGVGQKNVAIDQGLAPSTVALNARQGLEQLGLTCKPSRVHPLLMLAAKAGAKNDGSLAASLSSIEEGDNSLRVISVPRPDRRLACLLPPAELSVIRHLVEGLPTTEIAQLRQTSTRTIANQITAVFRRMRVSGRNELLSRLFFAEGFERVPQPRWVGAVESPRPNTLEPISSVALRSA